MKAIDISGVRFGRLTAVSDVGSQGGFRLWLCRCDCGADVKVNSRSLRSGNTSSCGCFRKQKMSELATARNLRHGHNYAGKESPTHKSWTAMIQRTTNSNYTHWKDYGGRGITVCDQWRSFEVFLADMGERPEGKTLDRINVNGNYEPGNCRWATLSEQQKNKRVHS